MIAALRYETVRVLTVRATWICLVLAVIGVTGLAYLASTPITFTDDQGNQVGDTTLGWWEAFSQPLLLTAILASIIAAQNLGQEYRFGVVRLTLTAFPQRGRILLAKAISVVVVALAFTAVSYAASYVGVLLHGFPTPPPTATGVDSTYLVRGAVFMVLWSLSAWALAGITRQTAIGIAVPIVSGFIVEQILGAVLRSRAPWLVDVLPWSTAGRWASVPEGPRSSLGPGDVSSSPPVGWAALGVFACWVLILVVLEVISFLRRDA